MDTRYMELVFYFIQMRHCDISTCLCQFIISVINLIIYGYSSSRASWLTGSMIFLVVGCRVHLHKQMRRPVKVKSFITSNKIIKWNKFDYSNVTGINIIVWIIFLLSIDIGTNFLFLETIINFDSRYHFIQDDSSGKFTF